MIEEIFEVATPDGAMSVIAKRPDDGHAYPVVVLFHDGPGVRPATHDVVHRIANAGYYVVAPDRYHRYGRFVHIAPETLMAAGRDSDLFKNFLGMVAATTDELVCADVALLLAHLASDPAAARGPMGCMGYCNGVRMMLHAMSNHPDAFAAGAGFHPSFCVSPDGDSPHLRVPRIQGELYMAFGAADHIASVEHNRPFIDELAKLGKRAAVDVLPDATHGFAMPGPAYHEEAAARSYQKALALFARTLKPSGQAPREGAGSSP